MGNPDEKTRDELADTRASLGPAGAWRLDPERSVIGFGVRKMGLYTVKGRFRRAAGELRLGDEGVPLMAQLTIEAASVTTRMPPRDLHLRSGQFLAARKHPTIRVVADTFWYDDRATLCAEALVAIKDATKRITLRAHPHSEPAAVALHVHATLDRHELGVTPPPPFSWIVGREVKLDALLVYVR
jgi:polyisoprenoid-binding protein YceI